VITTRLEAVRGVTKCVIKIFFPAEIGTGCLPGVSQMLSAGINLFIVTT
jgi:hypothetical protein